MRCFLFVFQLLYMVQSDYFLHLFYGISVVLLVRSRFFPLFLELLPFNHQIAVNFKCTSVFISCSFMHFFYCSFTFFLNHFPAIPQIETVRLNHMQYIRCFLNSGTFFVKRNVFSIFKILSELHEECTSLQTRIIHNFFFSWGKTLFCNFFPHE